MSISIGIEVGTHLVKVVHIEQRAKMHLCDMFMFPTPFLGNDPSKGIDAKSFFNSIVVRITQATLKKATIGVNIPSTLVNVMVINLPKMSRKELETAALAEAKRKMVPTPGPQSVFEYSVLGEIIVAQIPRYEVLVVKTEKTFVDAIVKSFSEFGEVYPYLISPTSFTILNVFSHNSEVFKTESAFIDIGYNTIDITIANKGNLYFHRNIKFGYKDIVVNISNTLGKDAAEMETVLQEKGVPEVEVDLRDKVKIAEEIMRQKYELSQSPEATQEINFLELRMLWETEIERIVHEVRRTMVYYKEQLGGERIANVFFLGGCAKIKGLVPALTRKIGGRSEILDPFKEMDLSVEEDQVEFVKKDKAVFAPALSIAVSVPLAKKRKRTLNFLPQELKQREITIRKQFAAIVTGIIIVSFMFLWWLQVFVNNIFLRTSVAGIELQMQKIGNVIDTLNGLQQQKEEIDSRTGRINEIIKSRLDTPIFLEEVGRRTPPGVIIFDFSLKGSPSDPSSQQTVSSSGIDSGQTQQSPSSSGPDIISIRAYCVADYETAVRLSGEFRDLLEASNYFTGVELESPALETMSPVAYDQESVLLTESKRRNFTLEAKIVK